MTPAGFARLREHLAAIQPTIVVNPEDAQDVYAAVREAEFKVKIEVTELAEPGQITIFQGLRWPTTDLGGV
jgi:hypothetical protein